MRRGKFITFEGLDGAGKSSHIDTVVSIIEGRGFKAVNTREPGGTPLAEKIRSLLLSEHMDLETETILMFAARQSHVSSVIRPALDVGKWVVCDRFTDATYAYQGGGRGVADGRISELEHWVHGDLQPDMTLLFDLPYEVARARIDRSRTLDRFEQEAEAFHERVRQAYLARAHRSNGRIAVIDASQEQALVGQSVRTAIEALFG
jgi:dTMP kinase